jgi:hypothetical protein
LVIGGGFNYSPTNINDQVFETPPPYSNLNEIPKATLKTGALDFMFKAKFRFFRLTVIGKHASKNNQDMALWVCKCSCGYYCLRRAKSLKVKYPCCGVCNMNNNRKQKTAYKSLGRSLTDLEREQIWQSMGGA